jgi:hypothetical protein
MAPSLDFLAFLGEFAIGVLKNRFFDLFYIFSV